ncbi:MAG TPA: asparagine synthase-related protein [Acidimicrobiales bacterium]
MSFVAAVAAGLPTDDAVPSRGAVDEVRHRDLAVAWNPSCPWVSTHDDGDTLVVLDGRLHNLGSPSAAQAELLLQRYRQRGMELADGLLGDFVVIVLDRITHTLLVGRDPLGVRPWYQASGAGGRHAGASDLATLAELHWVDTTVDEGAAIEYLAAVSASRGGTLYRGITTLRPGMTWLTDGAGARSFQHHRWDLAPDLEISWEDAAQRCRTVLDVAVQSRIDGHPTPVCEISGGLDSSAVVGTVARLGVDDVLVGRLIFDGPDADERAFSDAVIEHWGVPAVSAPPWLPTDEECLELTRSLRRPLPDPHFTMFVGLHRALLARGRPDGMTGLGGDDAFVTSGIGSRVVSSVRLRDRTVLGQLVRWSLGNPRLAWTDLIRPTLHHLAPWRGDRLPGWVGLHARKQAELPRLFRQPAKRVTGIAAIDDRIGNLTSGYDAAVLEQRALVADHVGRRDSHPFLDPRFVEATYGLDPWWPTRGDHTRALQIAAFGDRLPASVAERRSKADFAEVFWPQLVGEPTLQSVRTGPLAEAGWLDPTGFDRLTERAERGMANAAIPLSRCVALDRWLRAL